MEEILQELMKSTAEKGVQKQFYSNLTITTPLQEYSDVHDMISKGISFLERSCDAKRGFQSTKYTSRDCHERIQEESSDDLDDNDKDSKLEVYSSTLILDLLGDFTSPDSQINVSSSMLWKLKEFISPDFGIGPFNIFKRIDNSDTATLGEHNVDIDGNQNDDIDKEDVSNEKENDEEEQEEEEESLELPDDCNTTSLAIWVLLREKIMERKPAESLAQLLLANGNEENGEGIIQTFLPPRTSNRKNTFDTEGCLEPVVCANVMRLLYQLELSEEGTAESTEEFLYETLENYAAICAQDQDQPDDQHENTDTNSDLAKTLPITNQFHTSPDAFIYFLARAVTLSPKAKSRFWNLLAESLYDRIDTTDYPLDVAMRILTADELGLLNYDNQIRDSIVTDYKKLFQCQCEDGAWPADSLWQISGVHYGGKEITTAFACKAINSFYVANKIRKINKKLSLQACSF